MEQNVKIAASLLGLLFLTFPMVGCSDAAFVETRTQRQSIDANGENGDDADDGNPDQPENPNDQLAQGDDDSNDPDSPNYKPDGIDIQDKTKLPPLTEDQIKDRCKSGETQTRKIGISFPNPAKQCEWSKAGNLDLIQGIVTARHEAVNNLPIAADEVICAMQFSFAQQEIRYDDEISLLFNGRFLMHSVESDIRYFEKQSSDGFYIYDWSRFVGKPYTADYTNIKDYCIGAEDGKGSCSMPPTETNGMIKLEFNEDVTFRLSALADKERKGTFTWVTTGDNDPATDCQHMDIAFEVELITAKK